MLTLKYTIDGENFSRDLAPGNYIVGRSKSCDIVISEASISGQHLRIDVQENGEVNFRDLLSRNGTMLNGKKAQQGSLVNGNQLKLGHVQIDVQSDIAVAPAADGQPELAAPPPISGGDDFVLAPAPAPVDAEYSLAQMPEGDSGSVEIFRPDISASGGSTPADASRKRLPVLLAMLAVAAVFVGGIFYMDSVKQKKAPPEANPQQTYWSSIEKGAALFRDGDYSEAVAIWTEADNKLEGATGNSPRVGKIYADIALPFSQSKEGRDIDNVDWTTLRNKLLTMVNDGFGPASLRSFSLEMDGMMIKEITAGKVFAEGGQARAQKDWDVAVVKFREVPAGSIYYLSALNAIKEVEQERLSELVEAARSAGKTKNYSEAIKMGEEYLNRGGDDKLLAKQIEEWKNRRTVNKELARLRRLSREAKSAEEIDEALSAARNLQERFASDPDVMVHVPGVTRDLHERLYVVQLQQMYRASLSDAIKKHLAKSGGFKDNVTVKDIVRRWKLVEEQKAKADKYEVAGNIIEATKCWNNILLTEKNKNNQYNVYATNKLALYPPETIGKMLGTSATKAMNTGKYKTARSYLEKAEVFGADVKSETEALQKTGRQLFNKGIQYYHGEQYSQAREFINDARDCFAPDDPFFNKIEQWMRDHNITTRK